MVHRANTSSSGGGGGGEGVTGQLDERAHTLSDMPDFAASWERKRWASLV